MEQRFRDPAPGTAPETPHVPPVPGAQLPGAYPGKQMFGPPTMTCACGYQGHPLYAHPGYSWWLLPIWIPLGVTVLGMVPLLFWGNRTRAVCPQCTGTNFHPWGGTPSDEAERIYREAHQADRKAFNRNKLLFLGTVLAFLGAVVIFLIFSGAFGN